MEMTGNYEAARNAMEGLWIRVGERPLLNDLNPEVTAEVMLRTGVLTGWLGSIKQIEGAHTLAKDLISESILRFDALQNTKKTAEAQIELGHCYWREGAFGEARILLNEALRHLKQEDIYLRATALLRLATVEEVSLRLSDALQLLREAAPLFEISGNHTIQGRFHNEYGIVLKNLGAAEARTDYIDQALIEYAAASYHFEQAGHRCYQACVENNLGMLFCTTGKFIEAHQHLDRAQTLLTSLKDNVHLSQVDETRARVFLAEGRAGEAERLSRAAAQALERGGEQSLLAEALRTQGVALARLGRGKQARAVLKRAWEVAEQAGDLEGAGQAALTLVQEAGGGLGLLELVETFERADELLAGSRHPRNKDGLLACARRVLSVVEAQSGPERWKGFSFNEALHRFESRLLERALRDAGGVVAQAARLLGIKRQSLSSMLHTRHRELLPLRPPVEPHRRSLMFRPAGGAEARAVTILHVEDRREISDAVRETLETEGWRVEVIASGAEALRRLEGEAHYDVLIFDYSLPGPDGVELTRQARALPHRQRTPIIMLTASEVGREARRAGVNSFLRKPQDVGAIAETVARLLARQQTRPEERDEGDG
jgi:CheY-like chemotaxis protein/tetratricopeptide (TPR) repeat protein